MPIEDEIQSKLLEGWTPQSLIDQGYKKSTVYKVYSNVKAQPVTLPENGWIVQNYNFINRRYLPGQTIPVSFTFRNSSRLDLYAYRLGVKTTWMGDQWFAQEVRDLIKNGMQRGVSFSVPVPADLPFGEYELWFGVEGQYLPNQQFQSEQIQWSAYPEIIHVKNPPTSVKIFVSHSTQDLPLVRQLEDRLDNAGIAVTIAEDHVQPGVLLEEKFQRMIRESTLLLALLTEDGIRSQWVLNEVNYAIQINKPRILLKERSVKMQSPFEWIEFSKYDPLDATLAMVMKAISQTQGLQRPNDPVGAVLGVGILAFIVGALVGGSK